MSHLKSLAQCITFWACDVLSFAVPVAAPSPTHRICRAISLGLYDVPIFFLPLDEFASESVEYV